MMKRLTFLLLSLFLLTGAAMAEAPQQLLEWNGYVYTLNEDSTAAVMNYTGAEKEIVIPSMLDGHPLTAIGEEAFRSSDLRSVVIPDGVTRIGGGAFSYCKNLHTVSLPQSLREMGGGVFVRSGLRSIEIPEGIEVLEGSAFVECWELRSVSLPHSLRIIGSNAFGCTGLKSIEIPEGVVVIEDEAFDYCVDLHYAVLPKSLAHLGDMTFNNHDHRMGQFVVAAPDTYASIRRGNLIIDPSALKVSGDYSYTINSDGTATIVKCTASGDVLVPSVLDGYTVTAIGDSAFIFAPEIETVILPESITTIGKRAFRFCDRLTSVVLPSNLKVIEDQTFVYCFALESVVLPDGLERIGHKAFCYCENLEYISLPQSLKSIGNYAFADCSSLKELRLPHESVQLGKDVYNNEYDVPLLLDSCYTNHFETHKSIPYILSQKLEQSSPLYFQDRFWYSVNEDDTLTIEYYLAEYEDEESENDIIVVPQTIAEHAVSAIGDFAFYGIWAQEIILPEGITKIGNYAFADVHMKISLPSTVTYIGDFAFAYSNYYWGYSWDSVIPQGVTHIGDGAFFYAVTQDVTVPSGVKHIGDFTFYGVAQGSITLSEGVRSIGKYAFSYPLTYWEGEIEFLSLPSSLETIDSKTFAYMTDFFAISVPAGSHAHSCCRHLKNPLELR